MKTEKLLAEIGNINDDFIIEAANYKYRRGASPRVIVWGLCAVAACAMLIMVSVFDKGQYRPAVDYSNLPMLEISTDSGGYGFEGYWAPDINELKNANPWSENLKLSTLPVFKNTVEYNLAGWPMSGGPTMEQLQKTAEEYAKKLSLTIINGYSYPDEETLIRQTEGNFEPKMLEAYSYNAECDGGKITAHKDGTVYITFNEEKPLPFEVDLADRQSSENCAEYLLQEYADIFNLQNPKIDVWGSFNIYAERRFSLRAYGTAETINYETKEEIKETEQTMEQVKQILGYNFKRLDFHINEEGTALTGMRLHNGDLSQKIGDYPIITAKQAQTLLLNGNYVTSVPYEMQGQEFIAGVELVYRNSIYDTTFMPYYKFYVELPEEDYSFFENMRELGLKDYGAYYVPAVEENFIINMPKWQGEFN